ncbi:MAG TPA: ABC transporter ATP-binding protein [Bacillota bacterium]|jgi:putative ABC transport system ATP-binding protein|nr:ABC transporter ATP-binding protein [Bacillota bacterium]HRS22332.1 ABC transporter ATP-binding protein [Clostridia bacterium]HRU42068.1 ABC transporter ATP-binding protein [Candidatus Diapherotrites archaeon]HQE66390.1 ABC transporter ATP-binding protein [Bacillota bacterium]HQI16687.1 ABC transporter ATP-binding protein [Bacillota bacterium]
MSFITFENVERIYHVGGNIIKAVDDVSFGIEKGTVNVVLGQSGAGKTTVLNLLGGMDSPTKGRIIADNQEISGMTEYELTTYRRNKIGFVFQFYNLVPNLTVLENVLLAEEICKDPLDAKEMLIKVGLKDRMDNFPSQISGGEQQRVSIARALAKNPQILLCDEPTGALDSSTGRIVLKLIRDAARDMGKTVIIVTHNVLISEMADVVLHMKDGKISDIKYNSSPKAAEEIIW